MYALVRVCCLQIEICAQLPGSCSSLVRSRWIGWQNNRLNNNPDAENNRAATHMEPIRTALCVPGRMTRSGYNNVTALHCCASICIMVFWNSGSSEMLIPNLKPPDVVRIDVWIFCYFFPRTLEMVSQSFKISEFPGGACPQTPLPLDRLRDHFNQYFW